MSRTSTESVGERTRSAPFRRTFAITVTALIVLCAAFLGLGYLQGVKLSSGQVDTANVVAQPGQQLRLFANQAIENVTARQVTITPSTPFTVSSGGEAIAVHFADRLRYGTKYSVAIAGVTSLYQPQQSTLHYSFTTAAASLYYLDRAAPGEEDQTDSIVQIGLTGTARKVLYSAPHIQEFAAFPAALAVVTINDDGTSSLSLVSLRGGAVEDVPLPPGGSIEKLQSDSDAGLLGFLFSTGDGGPDADYANTLMTVDFNSTHEVQPVLGLDKKPLEVQNWFFLAGGTSIVAQTLDDSVLLLDPTKPGAPSPLGHYTTLDGSSPDGKSLVVGDAFGTIAYALSNGAEKRLQPLAIDGKVPFGGDLELTGAGTTRVQKVAVADEAGTRFIVSLVLDDGKKSRVLFRTPDSNGSIEAFGLSPNAQYVAVEEIPDVSASVSDGYLRDARSTSIATVIVDIATGDAVRTIDGFGVVWR